MRRLTSRIRRARWEAVLALLAESEEHEHRRSISKAPTIAVDVVDREVHRAVCLELELTRKRSKKNEAEDT